MKLTAEMIGEVILRHYYEREEAGWAVACGAEILELHDALIDRAAIQGKIEGIKVLGDRIRGEKP